MIYKGHTPWNFVLETTREPWPACYQSGGGSQTPACSLSLPLLAPLLASTPNRITGSPPPQVKLPSYHPSLFQISRVLISSLGFFLFLLSSLLLLMGIWNYCRDFNVKNFIHISWKHCNVVKKSACQLDLYLFIFLALLVI